MKIVAVSIEGREDIVTFTCWLSDGQVCTYELPIYVVLDVVWAWMAYEQKNR